MRKLPGLVSLALVSIALAGCGGAGKGQSTRVDKEPLPADTMMVQAAELGQYGGRFVMGQTTSPRTFNAPMANEQSSNDINNLLYAALTDIDYRTLADIPIMAKSWEFSSDGKTCTFHLRRGMKFSDGHPVTSADVRFSFDVVMSDSLHPSAQEGLSALVDGKKTKYTYSAPDSFTFVITAPKTDALLLAHVGSVRILPRHVLEAPFLAGKFASEYSTATPVAQVVTSGPWRLKKYVPDQQVVLEPNPYWFGVDAKGTRLPYLDEIVFVVTKDQDAALLKFHAGQVDGLDNVKPDDYADFTAKEKAEDFVLHDLGASYNTNFFWFNLNRLKLARDGRKTGDPAVEPWKYSLFNDLRFRRAVSMAINRDDLIKGPFRGFAVKNWTILTVSNKRWADSTVTGADYAPDQAKALLAELGLRDRNGDGILEDSKGHKLSFDMLTNSDNKLRVALATLIKDDLAKVGIEIIPAPTDFNTIVTKTRNEYSYDLCLLGLGSAVPADPGMTANVVRSSGITHYWHMKQEKPETEAERKMDEAFAANTATMDESVRKQTWHEVSQTLNDNVFFVWLPTQIMKIPVSARFGNVDPNPMPHRILWNADRIFQKRAPRNS